VAFGGGGRQLAARGGRTQRHSAQGVVEVVGEGLERRSVVAQRWRIWWGRSGEVVKEEEKGLP
jgi:hypothetical protein